MAGDWQGKAKLVKESNKQTDKATISSQEELTVKDIQYVHLISRPGSNRFSFVFTSFEYSVLMTETEKYRLRNWI